MNLGLLAMVCKAARRAVDRAVSVVFQQVVGKISGRFCETNSGRARFMIAAQHPDTKFCMA